MLGAYFRTVATLKPGAELRKVETFEIRADMFLGSLSLVLGDGVNITHEA